MMDGECSFENGYCDSSKITWREVMILFADKSKHLHQRLLDGYPRNTQGVDRA